MTECAWGRKLTNTAMPLEPCPMLATAVLVIDDHGDRTAVDLCADHVVELEVLGVL